MMSAHMSFAFHSRLRKPTNVRQTRPFMSMDEQARRIALRIPDQPLPAPNDQDPPAAATATRSSSNRRDFIEQCRLFLLRSLRRSRCRS